MEISKTKNAFASSFKVFAMSLALVFMLPIFCACKKIKLPEYMLDMDYKEGFKIMQLADVQVANSDECLDAFVDISEMVEREKPDLIVLTGDNIYIPESDEVLLTFISCMEALETPWAPVFGNHDAEGVLTKEYMAEKFTSAEHCLFHSGEEGVDGVGNYVINLKKKNKIMFSLFLIDSNMYHGDDHSVYDTIHANQVEWYERAVGILKKYNGKNPPLSLAFFHIPLFEYADAWESLKNGESTGTATMKEDYPVVYPGYENTGLFEKAKELKSTIGFFCGHDHINNCDILYEGIHMVYGLKSSRYSYYDPTMLGATTITLTKSGIEIKNTHFE